MIDAQTNTNGWKDVSVKVEVVLEKSDQKISNEKNEVQTESCKNGQEFNNYKEPTEEMENDEGHSFGEKENKNANGNGNNICTNFVMKRFKI